MAKINKCAKCGACTTPCPIYKISGRETLTARGRIHLLDKMDTKKTSKKYNEIFSRCLLCGACYKTCPRDINTPELIIKARENGANIGGFASFKKLLLQKSLSSPTLLIKSTASLQAIQKIAEKILPSESGLRTKLALFQQTKTHQKKGFIQSLQDCTPDETTKKVAYFPGCLANYLGQDIATASLNCLKKICNTEALAPPEQSCCGMAAFAAGNKKEAMRLARKNISAFNTAPYANMPIFTTCATCYAHLTSYEDLFKNDKKWREKAKSFSQRVCEFSSYISLNTAPHFHLKHLISHPKTIFYHDPCHLRFPKNKGKEIVAEPRSLLTEISKAKVVELAQGPQCCGQGGLFNIAHPKESQALCASLISEILKTNAEAVVTTCSGCLIQIQEGLSQKKSTLKTQHLALFLDEHLETPVQES